MAAKHKIAAGIFKLIKSESDARYDYETFLAEFPDLSSADIVAIQEIQRDEFNHALTLMAMARKYDGNLAPAPDGVVKAIEAISAGINDGDST
ncbi:MAG: hypothetical protein FWC89_11295 [Defluviitaleaceae bacterium]|nr:hypothetical protein [Defluviitaleaceae bacterium]